jgi:glycosyltransferase involved in cell wall biosynthesis
MKIATIIPAYNEEDRIPQVLNVVKDHNLINETIVVSDGSEDNTAFAARDLGVKVIELEENIGKGGAMQVGVDNTDAGIILFLDADLVGLNAGHIKQLLMPIIDDEVNMTVGIFTKGRVTTDLAQKLTPFLSGQRGVKRKIWQGISDLDMSRFGVEVAITKYVQENEIEIKKVILKDLTHVMKEEKLGFWKGLLARLKMYWEILRNFSQKKRNR